MATGVDILEMKLTDGWLCNSMIKVKQISHHPSPPSNGWPMAIAINHFCSVFFLITHSQDTNFQFLSTKFPPFSCLNCLEVYVPCFQSCARHKIWDSCWSCDTYGPHEHTSNILRMCMSMKPTPQPPVSAAEWLWRDVKNFTRTNDHGECLWWSGNLPWTDQGSITNYMGLSIISGSLWAHNVVGVDCGWQSKLC